jgi:hypothetical protein
MKLHHLMCLAVLSALTGVAPVAAQGMRDPTRPPAWNPEQSGGSSATRATRPPLSVISVNGKLHLIVGTRLYSQGQKLGDAVIEQISETEVWFREGRTLRKVSNFAGVRRHEATDRAVAPVR